MRHTRSNLLRLVLPCLVAPMVLWTPVKPAQAHGVWGHVHVTGWAIENLPEGALRDFFSEPEVLNAALFGAAFTDSGYSLRQAGLPNAEVAAAYSEHTHWEPFVEDYIQYLLAHDPPPFDTLESRQRVAFLMGCASHGLQDEIFDSLFLYQVQEHDDAGQSEADPGTDGFLALDEHIRFEPETYIPMDLVLTLYEGLSEEITEEIINDSVTALTLVYLNHNQGLRRAVNLGEEYLPIIPWTAEHYLDPDIPGSLHSEIAPTMAYMQAIWDRLHGTWATDEIVTYAYPAVPRRLRSHDATVPDSWVTFVYGIGVQNGSSMTRLEDDAAAPVDHTRRDTRWGGAGWSRLGRLQPSADLTPGAWYDAYLDGAEVVDGTTYEGGATLHFQVACDTDDLETCPDLGELPLWDIAGPEPPPMEPLEFVEPVDDVGPLDPDQPDLADMGTDDDVGSSDANAADVGAIATDLDAGAADFGEPDDTGSPDSDQQSDLVDQTPVDSASSGGASAQNEPVDDEGCSCATTRRAKPAWAMIPLLVCLLRRRRSAAVD